jgi:hypothetical protein
MRSYTGATEDAASGRAARPGGTASFRQALLVALLLLAGCGGSDGGSSERQVVDPATALGLSGGSEVTVRGFFAHEPGTVLPRMCPTLAESYPPRCALPSLPVSNLSEKEENKLPLTRDPETGGRWSQAEVELSGRIQDGALVVE